MLRVIRQNNSFIPSNYKQNTHFGAKFNAANDLSICPLFRFSMPATLLRQLRPELFPDSEDEEDVFDSNDLDTDHDVLSTQN